MSYEEEVTDLRARVRELEADLAFLRKEFALRAGNEAILKDAFFKEKARAEKAEVALRVAEDNEEDRAGQVDELDEKVRELEAELARRTSAVGGCDHSGVWCEFADFLWARAEKAEAFIREWNEHPLRSRKDEEKYWYARFKEQQARVAELEAELQRLADEGLTAREREEG